MFLGALGGLKIVTYGTIITISLSIQKTVFRQFIFVRFFALNIYFANQKLVPCKK